MTNKKTACKQNKARTISVRLQLEGGHSQELILREDSPKLATLFRVLASRGSNAVKPAEQFLQLPLENGRAAFSFNSTQLVSVVTEPPVVVRIEHPPEPAVTPQQAPEPVVIHTPKHMIIDNFLSHDEHRDMLAFALANKEAFEAGTVINKDSHYRQNLVILNFNEFAHSGLICNRLLTWLPQMLQTLGMSHFPVEDVEAQLTASNDGHFYRVHMDGGSAETGARVLACVYYFFREPRAFSGGALRLYDTWQQDGQSMPADSYKEIEPVSNRMLVFPSDAHHELMRIRCPSRQFEDGRFAIINWVRRRKEPDPEATFGWGHYRCGAVPECFSGWEQHR